MRLSARYRTSQFGGASAPAPVVNGTKYEVMSTNAGGNNQVVYGLNLANASKVTIAGIDYVPVAVTATSVEFANPGKAPGTYALTVTTPGGTSTPINIEFWTPVLMTDLAAFYDASLGASPSAWVNQGGITADLAQANASNQPPFLSNPFGNGRVGYDFRSGGKYMSLPTKRFQPAGRAVFWIGKQSNDFSGVTQANPGNIVMTLMGDTTGTAQGGIGHMGSGIGISDATNPANTTNKGAGFSDGAQRLYGVHHKSDGTATIFNGGMGLGGATVYTSYDTAKVGWNVIGAGTGLTELYRGILGAVIVLEQDFIDSDQTVKLAAWGAQSYNCPQLTIRAFGTSVGSTGGGYSATVAAYNKMSDATGMTIDGVAVSGFTVLGPHYANFVMPAGTAGIKTVVIQKASGNHVIELNGWEYWSPASLPLTSWFKPPFTGLPWVGSASTGLSVGRNLIATADPAPTVSPLQQAGKTPARFLSTSNVQASVNKNALFSAAQGFFMAITRPRQALPAPGGQQYQDGNLIADTSNAEIDVGITSAGAFINLRSAGQFNRTPYAAAGKLGNSVMTMVQACWDSSTLRVRANPSPWAGLACGAYDESFDEASKVNKGYNTGGIDQDIFEWMTCNAVPSNTNLDKLRAYFATEYASSVV